jgi:arginine exporter protein ArgO
MSAAGMAAATTTAIAGKRVLAACLMGCVADVALSVASFIALEVVEGTRTATWERTVVTIMGVIAVVYVAVKTARAVEPGAGAKEHAADEPVGAVVTVRSAIVRSVVEVAIRANGGYSNADGDLSGSRANRSSAEKGDRQS